MTGRFLLFVTSILMASAVVYPSVATAQLEYDNSLGLQTQPLGGGGDSAAAAAPVNSGGLTGSAIFCTAGSVNYNPSVCSSMTAPVAYQPSAVGQTLTPAASPGPVTLPGVSQDCQTAYTQANMQCNAAAPAARMAGGAQMGAGVAGAAGGTNAVALCQAMGMQTGMAEGLTLLTSRPCTTAASNCENVCTTSPSASLFPNDATTAKTCKSWHSSTEMAEFLTLAMLGMTAMEMGQCSSILQANQQGLCGVGSANPLCSFQGSNGLGAAPNGLNPNGFPQALPPTPTDPAGVGDDLAGNLYNGNPAGQGTGPQFGTGDTAGGGGMGMGSGAYPGGSGSAAAGGQQGGNFKTDIGGGVGGGGGGYTVGGIPTEGGGAPPRYAGDGNNLDLSRFLPGGDLDPAKRGLASLDGLAGQGITGANDFSNFEKVTRTMNKHRPLLLP